MGNRLTSRTRLLTPEILEVIFIHSQRQFQIRPHVSMPFEPILNVSTSVDMPELLLEVIIDASWKRESGSKRAPDDLVGQYARIW